MNHDLVHGLGYFSSSVCQFRHYIHWSANMISFHPGNISQIILGIFAGLGFRNLSVASKEMLHRFRLFL